MRQHCHEDKTYIGWVEVTLHVGKWLANLYQKHSIQSAQILLVNVPHPYGSDQSD